MANSSEQLKLSFNYGNQCNSITKETAGLIHPNELSHIDRPCTGTGHNIIDCKSSNLQSHYNQINGLSFDKVVSNGKTPKAIPYFIPIYSRRLSKYRISSDIIGVTLKDIFEVNPIYKRFGVDKARKTLKLKRNLLDQTSFNRKNTILFSSGKDCLIEEIWKHQKQIDYYTNLNKIGFNAATSINFSLFSGECPLSHSLNLKKSLFTFEKMQIAGLSSIPNVYFTHDNHLVRWVKWLKDNPDINYISYNSQLCNKDFLPFVNKGLRYILQQVPQLHILLEGPTRKLLESLKDVSHSFHIATKWPSECAINYRKFCRRDGRWILTKYEQSSIESILESNHQQFQLYLEENFYGMKMPTVSRIPDFKVKSKTRVIHKISEKAG